MKRSAAQRDSIRLIPRFNYNDTVAVYRNPHPKDGYIWQIDALEGRMAGRTVGVATEVPLVGPVTLHPGAKPAVAARISPKPLALQAAQWCPRLGMWGRPRPTLAILTSDGELWVVHTRHKVSH